MATALRYKTAASTDSAIVILDGDVSPVPTGENAISVELEKEKSVNRL